MAKRKKAIKKAFVKMPKIQKPVSIVYNVYVESLQVNEQPKEKNLTEKILSLGMALVRMLIMCLA
jgi:hypothetical protein